MANVRYDKQLTALLVIDPYNDFISEGGKVWDRVNVAEANKRVPHMMQVLDAARKQTSRFVCAAPSISPWRLRELEVRRFRRQRGCERALNTGPGRRDPQRIRAAAGRHCGPRALVFQWLCQHRCGFAAQEARHPSALVMGLIAHTCVEATVRYAAELGYEVTMIKDATADYSDEEMHAALDVNIPNYASAVVTTNEVVASLSSVQT
jgi:ureidoacrylate peracid hydrolase